MTIDVPGSDKTSGETLSECWFGSVEYYKKKDFFVLQKGLANISHFFINYLKLLIQNDNLCD